MLKDVVSTKSELWKKFEWSLFKKTDSIVFLACNNFYLNNEEQIFNTNYWSLILNFTIKTLIRCQYFMHAWVKFITLFYKKEKKNSHCILNNLNFYCLSHITFKIIFIVKFSVKSLLHGLKDFLLNCS